MTYFAKFPTIPYVLSDGKNRLITDIFRRVELSAASKNAATLFFDYEMKDDDTPEIIAHKIYRDANLHWVVLLCNQTVNPYYDLSLSWRNFSSYMESAYSGTDLFFLSVTGTFKSGESVSWTGGSAVIEKWDPTFQKLNVSNLVGTVPTNGTSISSASGSGIVRRIISDVTQSLAYFTDDGTVEGTRVSPFWVPGSDLREEDYDLQNGSSVLSGYIKNMSEFDPYIVTNQEHENAINESKRKIKLIRVDYIPSIISELERVLESA